MKIDMVLNQDLRKGFYYVSISFHVLHILTKMTKKILATSNKLSQWRAGYWKTKD
ncbi:hypothetical protein PM8797T_28004 [Gimesia maris DSM 8797]|nr:hypothetical protein PM8797T_28004 [Gimesia maris DSM 8797]